ncbi:hypothetical protein DV736_g6637, partial [Chaetothyriales sp. CBS 134916]
FILLHPTQQNQQCSCQSYHLSRIAPGSICDCGHQACYHVHVLPAQDQARPPQGLSPVSEQALLARTKGLEEALRRERHSREADVLRVKELWESDIRMLREALAPLYKADLDMRRKLIELEDRVDGNYDEQVRLKDRLVTLDDANMVIEKRMQDMEARPKRRRVRQPNGEEEHLANGNGVGNGTRTMSNHVDERSVQSSSSRALSPQSSFTAVQEPEEPRSSGILNLVDPLRPRPYGPLLPPIMRRPVLYEREEPRSSGFLALDLAEREGRSNKKVLVGQLSPRKRKHMAEHMALDVLADVSMASPLIPSPLIP